MLREETELTDRAVDSACPEELPTLFKANNNIAEPFLMLGEEGEHIFPCCLARQTTGRKCSALKSLFQSHVLKEQVTSKSYHKITTCHLLVTNVQEKLLVLLPCFCDPNVCMCQ